MPEQLNVLKNLLSTSLLFFSVLIFTASVFVYYQNPNAKILGIDTCPTLPCSSTQEPTVTISAYIKAQGVKFKVYPEKRHTVTGNWSTVANITMENCQDNTQIDFNNIITNDNGEGQFTLPESPVVAGGTWRFYVKGLSHLIKKFNCYPIDRVITIINLYAEDRKLKAGEISPVFDNLINSLDLSFISRNLYTNNNISDLNFEGTVNALDLSNLIYNYYQAGD